MQTEREPLVPQPLSYTRDNFEEVYSAVYKQYIEHANKVTIIHIRSIAARGQREDLNDAENGAIRHILGSHTATTTSQGRKAAGPRAAAKGTRI